MRGASAPEGDTRGWEEEARAAEGLLPLPLLALPRSADCRAAASDSTCSAASRPLPPSAATSDAGTNACAKSASGQNTSAKNFAAQCAQDGRSCSTQALSKQVDRGHGKSLEAGLDLIQDALVLGILHDAGDLLLVVLGLSRHQSAKVILDALDRAGNRVVCTERIGNHAHTHGRTTGHAYWNISRLTEEAFVCGLRLGLTHKVWASLKNALFGLLRRD
jgi:hypothetical protein